MNLEKYIAEVKERVENSQPNSDFPLKKAYSYTPCGHYEDEFAVSWNGNYRFVERISEKFAKEIVKALTFSISSRTDIQTLLKIVKKQDAALALADAALKGIRVEREAERGRIVHEESVTTICGEARADITKIIEDSK